MERASYKRFFLFGSRADANAGAMIRGFAFFTVFLILYLIIVFAISRESERLSGYQRRLTSIENVVRLAEIVNECD